MTINKERLKLGLDALRSGEYQQVQNTLCSVRDDGRKYCCLGVLTRVAMDNGLEMQERQDIGRIGFIYPPDEETGEAYVEYSVLPVRVTEWYGFRVDNPMVNWVQEAEDGTRVVVEDCTAAELNDRYGQDFEQIADILEATYLKVEG